MLTRATCARPWRGSILTLAIAACALAAWSAGPAQANGPVAGVPAPVAAVSQAATPVVTAIQSSPAASPGRPAARVGRARAAVADSVERAAAAVEPVSNGVAGGVETAAGAAATASKSEHVAAVVRTASERTASGVRNAPRQAAAAPKRLVAAANTAGKLGSTISATALTSTSRQGPTAPDGVAITTGAALPATANGDAVRHSAAGGWRNATAVREAPARPLEPAAAHSVLTTQPATPTSAGAAPAGIAAMALVGLLGLLSFSSQRLGAVVWLRPVSAPASPFLALPERPG